MRKLSLSALLCSAALAALLAGAGGAWAKPAETPAKAEVEVKFDPESVDSFAGAYLAAFTADSDGDYKHAIELYRVALDFEPNNLQIQERLMINLFLNGDFDDGVKLAQTLKKDPAVERVTTLSLGIDAIRQKQFSKARKLLVYKGPNDLDRMMNSLLVAWADFGAGKKKEALDSIVNLNGPEWFKIFKNYHAGVMSALAGDKENARKYLTNAITDKEGGAAAQDVFVRSVIALAGVESQSGDKQKALDALASGEELTGRYAPFQTVRDMIEKGQPIKQQVASPADGASAVLFSIGSALNQSVSGNAGMRDNAQEIVAFYLNAALALSPDSADVMILLGSVADGAGKPEKAIDYYSKVDPASPMHRVSELQMGLDLGQTGKHEEAVQHLKKLIAEDPSDFRSYLALGSVYADKENYAAMASTYDDAVKAIGPNPTRGQWAIFYQRGIAYERLKKWADAEPNFKKALELFPDQPQVLNYLGYSWIDMNTHLDEGMAMIKKAVDIRPDDGYIVDSLGWAYYRTGKYEDAVRELQRAVQLKEGDATINDHYGDALWRVGRKLEATFQWNRALVAKPEPDLEAKIKAKLKDGLPDLNGKTPAEADAEKAIQAPASDAPGKKS
ncbi:tetratricopeptide repeat protein [Rhizobium sp. C1]|uniref:tetratricopeptide repeat protein n=1 Tax=Rhizobium sp. C1 TaxID=1349799 RepID=UPI001E431059|nr:tetratricopeptide repeat protein [Rhizobium sp. C1]MCD2179727.1 tetratricopeptide repeat protein [Rhizobium sp. C1]